MTTPSPAMKWLAIAAILGTGLIHVVEARDAFGDATYKGLLFIGNGVGALAAAIGIYRDQRALGWLLGLLVAGGAILAYVEVARLGCLDFRLNRTRGLSQQASHPFCARRSS